MSPVGDLVDDGPHRSWPERTLWFATLSAGGVVAFGLVLFVLSRRNGLYGLTEYDDGVYFGSALRFVNGQMPYRDFVFVQPPGITLLLSPLALIARAAGSREGLALARILTAVVAGANAVLIAYLVRHKGKTAMFVASMSFAVFPPAFIADRSVELEPYMILFCLIGAAVIFRHGALGSRKHIVIGGFLFGVAGTIKSFALMPVIALIVVLACKRRRDLPFFVAAVAAGFILLCLPFFIASPHAFLHDVITAQLGRQTLKRATLPTRLAALTGLSDAFTYLRHFGPGNRLPAKIAAVITAVIVLGAIVPAVVRRAGPFEWFVIASAILSVAAILIAPSFYNHYTYLSETFIAMLFGFVAQRTAGVARKALRLTPSSLRVVALSASRVIAVAALVSGAGLLVANESSYAASVIDHDGDPGPAIAAFIPAGACTVTDAASLLIAANRFESSDASCPSVIDATGTWIAFDANHPPLQCRCGPPEPGLTAEWQQWLSAAHYAIFSGVHTFRIPWTPALMAWFDAHFTRVPGSHLPIFEQVTTKTAAHG